LGDAAYRAIGNGRNQIPDMSLFDYRRNNFGYQKLPSGIIIQWGRITGDPQESSFSFPLSFPERCVSIVGSEQSNTKAPTVATFSGVNRFSFVVRGWNINNSNAIAMDFGWIAVGY
jgi:hypothetical protein